MGWNHCSVGGTLSASDPKHPVRTERSGAGGWGVGVREGAEGKRGGRVGEKEMAALTKNNDSNDQSVSASGLQCPTATDKRSTATGSITHWINETLFIFRAWITNHHDSKW